MGGTAIDHGPVNPDARGDQRLFKLVPPMEDEDGDAVIDWVVVSKADVPFSGWETYIFHADYEGRIVDWSELPGSQRGDVSHEEALSDAGYDVITNRFDVED